ncbi:gliding motility-associated ABC transporter substrate-binding protein GldG [Salegentibacter mishustinae]|uniref:Gliding motility-associated ABC transporter substrate-binding protein GldG n=1 Tax=Salegentibacter mishustinae TaxID=270918 RepID=A0A0Q9ZJJ5_9FLAO|nr:gliding motility-associated ABC transporter substrate-binding protein GldG [Salegentibacter mishustinae]KRG28999.1 gliding motility-associated ABC transporter substrate-binding protein GldG [Salegentibacter mishustinae]PNW21949.1 gliding motility-associated ABC transporter substrate-binding protein GldG [Salegentibacter mishustinae]PZX65303.1 ABC-2 type transport system permease protein [Salegentibacter mishustinae]GGW85973.1 gliding motility-associated ABC transporter substrate-binding prot
MKHENTYKNVFLWLVAIVAINLLAANFFERIDLTRDQRYTLSPAAMEIVSDTDSPIVIEVFLEGNFPSEFRRLRNETRQMLEEFSAYNSNIKFTFTNPLEESKDAEATAQEFYQQGMPPARVSVQENGKSSEALVFPWAVATMGDQKVQIPLLKNKLGATDEERVSSSVQQLEYAIANALNKLVYPRKKKIAVMRGNGELPDAQIASFIKTLQEYYFMAPFTLDSAAINPQKTLQQLKEYDLIIEAKPTEAFTENEKYILDQYTMSGGKSLWLTEAVAMETDSLLNPSGIAFALPRDLNLGDFFFSYGIRINPVLINDIYSAPIILASGQGNNTRFNPYPWFYSPLTTSPNDHPIINNIEAVKFEYANQIDTLQNNIEKTILLSSSPQTRVEGTPREISLEMVSQEPNLASYKDGEQPLAVLLEGEFTSVYKNRIKPFEIEKPLDQSEETKMLVISDGDVIKNEVQRGKPLELGLERYTGNTYGNKEFLLNAVNYMLDDSGLIDIRSKEINIAFLDDRKTADEREKWQMINIVLPLVILGLFAFGFNYFRKRKYLK